MKLPDNHPAPLEDVLRVLRAVTRVGSWAHEPYDSEWEGYYCIHCEVEQDLDWEPCSDCEIREQHADDCPVVMAEDMLTGFDYDRFAPGARGRWP